MDDRALALNDEFLVQSIDLLDQSMVKLENCLRQLAPDQIWWRPGDQMNSIGNLALHLCGNLRQWAVTSLSDLPDDRQRDEEFSDQSGSGDELLDRLNQTVAAARQSILENCGPGKRHQLTDVIQIQGFDVTVCQAVLHTTSHFVGHTHQIIMMTRMQRGDDYQFAWLSDGDRKRLPI